MRMRFGFFACLLAASILIGGCSGEEKKPPPGTDTDTPTLDIDVGDIAAPDEGGTATKKADEGEDDGGNESEGEG